MTAPADWYPDPLGRYEHRYWDGTQWTAHVATAGETAHDPLEDDAGGAAGQDAGAGAGQDETQVMGTGEPTPEQTGPAGTGTPQPGAGGPGGQSPTEQPDAGHPGAGQPDAGQPATPPGSQPPGAAGSQPPGTAGSQPPADTGSQPPSAAPPAAGSTPQRSAPPPGGSAPPGGSTPPGGTTTPPAGQPAPATQPTGPGGQGTSTNGKAIASLLVSILLGWIPVVGGAIAIVLGLMARREINDSGGAQSGDGLAIAGIVLGVLGIIAWIGIILLIIVGVSMSVPFLNELERQMQELEQFTEFPQSQSLAVIPAVVRARLPGSAETPVATVPEGHRSLVTVPEGHRSLVTVPEGHRS